MLQQKRSKSIYRAYIQAPIAVYAYPIRMPILSLYVYPLIVCLSYTESGLLFRDICIFTSGDIPSDQLSLFRIAFHSETLQMPLKVYHIQKSHPILEQFYSRRQLAPWGISQKSSRQNGAIQ